MRLLLWKFTFVFVVLFIATFDFPYRFIPNVSGYINPFVENLVYWSGTTFFGCNNYFNTVISSDSVGMYIHTFNLIFISGLLSFIWHKTTPTPTVNIRSFALKIIPYYLSLQMLMYGFNKVFGLQFTPPEPNLLFTNLGDLTPDILYWSTVGSSWSYTLSIGLMEVLVGVFLLFKKTRLIGIIIGIGVMSNVVLINFSYDISVKLYASFLLILFGILAIPFSKYLYASLVLQKPIPYTVSDSKALSKTTSKARLVLKSIVVLIFFIEGFFPVLSLKNTLDDSTKFTIFNGAYEVIDTPSSKTLNWDYVFVHSYGYFIAKSNNSRMQDYQLEIDTTNKKMFLTRYDLNKSFELHYELKNKKCYHIYGTMDTSYLDVYLQKINPKTIPLLNSEFHWTTTH